jgi:hypothetical protein
MPDKPNQLPPSYIVWRDSEPDAHGNRWRFTTPRGDYDSEAWRTEPQAAAAAHRHASRQES